MTKDELKTLQDLLEKYARLFDKEIPGHDDVTDQIQAVDENLYNLLENYDEFFIIIGEQIYHKISQDKYSNFVLLYFKGKYKNLRFGQAFMNRFYPEISEQEIFYETDLEKVAKLILERFVSRY